MTRALERARHSCPATSVLKHSDSRQRPAITRRRDCILCRPRRFSKALGVQTFREDQAEETEFVTISYWESVDDMSSFTGGDPTAVHHLERDAEFLIELPRSVQVLRLLKAHGIVSAAR